jgi:hypothetical protein
MMMMAFMALKVHPDAPAAAPSGSFSRARRVSPGDSEELGFKKHVGVGGEGGGRD